MPFPQSFITLAIVKKFLPILFLSIYLISATEMSQLLKMPLLVQHYLEHKEENHSITIWQFLYMHYALENAKDTDNKDMKLPFKTSTNISYSIALGLPNKLDFDIKPKTPLIEIKKIYYYQSDFASSNFLSFIWQPPKAC